MPRTARAVWAWAAILLMVAPGCGGGRPDGDDGETPMLVTRTLHVTGMTCDGCEAAIQDAVGKLPGVVAVEANHETSKTTVVYDTAAVSEQSIADAIEELGYSVEESG